MKEGLGIQRPPKAHTVWIRPFLEGPAGIGIPLKRYEVQGASGYPQGSQCMPTVGGVGTKP